MPARHSTSASIDAMRAAASAKDQRYGRFVQSQSGPCSLLVRRKQVLAHRVSGDDSLPRKTVRYFRERDRNPGRKVAGPPNGQAGRQIGQKDQQSGTRRRLRQAATASGTVT